MALSDRSPMHRKCLYVKDRIRKSPIDRIPEGVQKRFNDRCLGRRWKATGLPEHVSEELRAYYGSLTEEGAYTHIALVMVLP